MSIPMEDLRKEFQAARTEEHRQRALAKMEDLRLQAENSIRSAQKNIAYSTREFPIETILQKYQDGKQTEENELFIPDYQRDVLNTAKVHDDLTKNSGTRLEMRKTKIFVP